LLANSCVLGNVTILKVYQDPTSPNEKWRLGIQLLASFLIDRADNHPPPLACHSPALIKASLAEPFFATQAV
jgi:hypothetical protein